MPANNTVISDANINANVPIIETDQVLLDYAYSMKQMREGYEPQAYLSRRAYEGKHFTYWNKNLKQLVEIPQKKSVPTTLPEIKKQCNAFENFLVSTNYVFTVVPQLLSEDDAVKQSMMLSQLARTYHKKLKDTTVLADAIHYAIVDSNVSFIEVSPDSSGKDVDYFTWDFFDILFNPLIRKWQDQMIVCKIIKKNVHEMMRSSLYTLGPNYMPTGVGGEWRSWKDVYEAERYQSFAELDKDMVLIFEFHILESYTKEDGTKGVRLRIRSLDGAAKVIRNDTYDSMKRIPIQPIRIYSGEWWQPGFAYDLISPQRSLDTMANRFDDLFLRLTKGGYIAQEEEDIQGQMNEEIGQIVKYAAVKPEQIQMGSVPNFLVELFNTFLSLSDRYGLNSILTGTMPNKASGLRASKMINDIKGLTQQNNTSPLDNLKASIKGLLELTFMFQYELWDEPQSKVESDDPNNSPKFISEKFGDLNPQENIFTIPKDFRKFEVEIDDGLGYTLDKRKENAVQLYNLKDEQGKPILSSQALKKIFKLGASGYLMEADEKPMHETKEFQALINAYPQMSDQEKQAVQQVLGILSKQNANNPAAASNPNNPLMQQIQGGGGGANPPSPEQPEPQGGSGGGGGGQSGASMPGKPGSL